MALLKTKNLFFKDLELKKRKNMPRKMCLKFLTVFLMKLSAVSFSSVRFFCLQYPQSLYMLKRFPKTSKPFRLVFGKS